MSGIRLTTSFLIAFFFAAISLPATQAQIAPMQLAELTPTERADGDWFGISVCVSGDTIVVGAFDPNIEQYGSVYVYVKPSGGWSNMTQVAELTSSDNAPGFGTSVAISGNTIIVGAANASNFDAPAESPCAAYVFVEPSGGWTSGTETAKLTASDGEPGDAFGNSVSISGNTIAVGAFFAADNSGNSFAGKTYVFVEPPSGWAGNLTQTAELTASDSELLNYMGASVAVSGNTVVAGAYGHNNFQGAAYVFVEPPGGWKNMTQRAELTASDGKGSADFGFSTAVSGNTIVIGAVNALNSKGAAYVFVKPSGGWTNMSETAELAAPHATEGDSFGQSAAISGNFVIIGAPAATVGSNQLEGAAYVFRKPRSGWKNTNVAAELTASDGSPNGSFGAAVSISGSTGVAGAPAETYQARHMFLVLSATKSTSARSQRR
jgi:hypothetical protein